MLVAVTRRRIVWGGFALVVIAVLAMYAINPYHVASLDPRPRVLGFEPFTAPSQSMEPTVHEKAFFLANVMALRNRDPAIGEIIVFRYPPAPTIKYLKRVIATGGMTVEMRKGVVYLDGKRLDEPWLPKHPITEIVLRGERFALSDDLLYSDMPPARVPENQFFVLGDNRGNSEDSRRWGFVPREFVYGTYVKVF